MLDPCVEMRCTVNGREYSDGCIGHCKYAKALKDNEKLQKEIDRLNYELKWVRRHLNTDT